MSLVIATLGKAGGTPALAAQCEGNRERRLEEQGSGVSQMGRQASAVPTDIRAFLNLACHA